MWSVTGLCVYMLLLTLSKQTNKQANIVSGDPGDIVFVFMTRVGNLI